MISLGKSSRGERPNLHGLVMGGQPKSKGEVTVVATVSTASAITAEVFMSFLKK